MPSGPVGVVIERRVAAALGRAGCSGKRATLVAAVSGGPDSTALLRCLHGLSESHALTLHAAHLNHDFRGAEADTDADFARDLAVGLGLDFTVAKEDPVEYQARRGVSSFEQAAREMRYSFLARTAAAVGARAVATGHTADDLAETVLLHVLRGSGLHGLRGMTESAPWPWPPNTAGIFLFRPLLEMTKDETRAYCLELGQPYRDDSGNYMWRFARNRVRHRLMPQLAAEFNPRVREALVRLARTAADDVDYLEAQVDRVWPEVAQETPGRVTFAVSGLSDLHPALQRLALRRGYALVRGDVRRLGAGHLDAVLGLLEGRRGGRSVDLPRGVRAIRTGGELQIGRETVPETRWPELHGLHSLPLPSLPAGQSTVTVGDWTVATKSGVAGDPRPWDEAGGREFIACLDRPALGEGPLVVRTRRPGDRFQPLGMTGHKKLQDFFVDSKTPRDWRSRIPLLIAGERVAWVVGYRTASWVAPGGENRPVLWIKFSPGV